MSRKRNPNFTDAELQILLDEVERNKSILFLKLSNVATFSSKTKVWENICRKVNAANTDHKRSVDELRKKWSTCTSNAKKQAALVRRESRKTGGGPSPAKITPLQDKVVGIIGNTPVDGIEGGIDSCMTDETVGDSLQAHSQTRDLDSSYENGKLLLFILFR
jgi:hypothetical protein